MKWGKLWVIPTLAGVIVGAYEVHRMTTRAPATLGAPAIVGGFAIVGAPAIVQTPTIAPVPSALAGTPTLASSGSCDTVASSNRQLFSDALSRLSDASTDGLASDGGVAKLDDFLPQPCLTSKSGAWTVALDSFESMGLPMFEATWSLVHIDANGAITRYRDEGSLFTADVAGGSSGPEKFWTNDFEDDSEPEIIFIYSLMPVEFAETKTTVAFRFADGKIAPYVPVLGFTAFRDVDADGRFDAVVDHQAEDYGGCGEYDGETLLAPTIVAHGIPGGFSTTDDLAKRTAQRACPKRPTKIVASSKGQIDEDVTAVNTVCARAWGVSEAEVTRQIQASCHPFDCKGLGTRPALPGECFHLRTLLEWAKEPPAVTLP